MADYCGLVLDSTKIDGAIGSFPGLRSLNGPIPGAGFNAYEIEVEGQEPAKLQVFARNDGLFTLQYKLGRNRTLSEEVAKHVAEACTTQRFEPKPLSLKFISEDDWTFLTESLTEDGFKLDPETIPHCQRFKVTGSDNDHIFIHRYVTGSFLMQGRPRNAYCAVVNFLSYTTTEQKDLIESQLATVAVTAVDSHSLLSELEQRIPMAWCKMDSHLKTMLAPALVVLKLSIDLPDYSMLVFPAIRGMEGSIKDLFGKRGYLLGSKLNLGDQFDQHTKKVTPAVRANLGCAATCAAVERIYGFFSIHRNGLLHIDSVVSLSRIIETQKEAIELVGSAFHTIETAYANIP